MRVVLDTSAAMDIVLHEPGADALQRTLDKAEWIEAPELFIAEAANVCWKNHKQGRLALDHCEPALSQAIGLMDAFIPAEALYQEAFGLAVTTQRAVYDMFFLVLARRHNAILLSSDKGLLSLAARHGIRTH